MQTRRPMPNFIPATGRTLHLVAVWVNRIRKLQSTEIAVFYNDGNAHFTQQVIAPTGSQNQTLGGDGDSDILGANHGYFGAPDEASSSLTPWKVDARPSVAGVDATPSHAVPGNNCGYICDGSGATMLVDLSQAITVWPNTTCSPPGPTRAARQAAQSSFARREE
jgi:hypothetical protein